MKIQSIKGVARSHSHSHNTQTYTKNARARSHTHTHTSRAHTLARQCFISGTKTDHKTPFYNTDFQLCSQFFFSQSGQITFCFISLNCKSHWSEPMTEPFNRWMRLYSLYTLCKNLVVLVFSSLFFFVGFDWNHSFSSIFVLSHQNECVHRETKINFEKFP